MQHLLRGVSQLVIWRDPRIRRDPRGPTCPYVTRRVTHVINLAAEAFKGRLLSREAAS